MIKAVIFDIDGVLLDSFEANFKFFTDLLNKFGYLGPTLKEHRETFHLPMKEIIKIFSKSEIEEEIEKIYKAGLGREVSYPLQLLKTPDNLKEIVKILNKNYTLGIVTSRGKVGVFEVPQLSGLKKYFKVVVTYEDTKNHKPHPDPLLLMAQKLNLKSTECVYVGDSASDMVAAKAAGMKIIMYSENLFEEADAQTFSFKELPDLIKTL